MKYLQQNFVALPGIIVLFLLLAVGVPVAFAHKSPASCVGSGLNINLHTDVNQVHIGDTISLSANIFNGLSVGPVVCDASGIAASITTPDGIIHPITLTRTSLSNGEHDFYANAVTYVARAQDVTSGNILNVTALVTGTIHQNDTDSSGGGNQEVNITVLATVPPVVVPPPVVIVPPVVAAVVVTTAPSGGGGGFVLQPLISIVKVAVPSALPEGPREVVYTFTVRNTGPIPMRGVWVKDDICPEVRFLFGDSNNNLALDTDESWVYECTQMVTETVTNVGTTHGSANGWDVYDTAQATVVVTLPIPQQPVVAKTSPVASPAPLVVLLSPKFPDAGVHEDVPSRQLTLEEKLKRAFFLWLLRSL